MKQIKTTGYQLPYRTKEQLHELFGAKSIPPPESTKETRDIEVALIHPLKESSGESKSFSPAFIYSLGKYFLIK